MAIETKVNSDEKTKGLSYPYIGTKLDLTLVILFIAPDTGVVLKGFKDVEVGEYREDWLEDNFIPLTGEVVLRNILRIGEYS